ncbi:hypothetical protein HO173_009854 [Letharia columbiana]|uniref:DNA (cytosine-5-)-methyltransferase n=1 Tax=Letharia columbiana TaxID=112416 RepID=A0A8H6FNY3_9LECA|nr:uncharacterized protein HO173_009854 [Letharia columbiana]KAF6232017.1 hypothetical protein HO173_009854 [Letharia columbiana]
MPGFPPVEDGLQYQPNSSDEDGSDCQSSSSEEDWPEHQPATSEDDDSEYHPSLSEEDESDDERHRPRKTIHIHQASVTLNDDHLGANTDLEVGTVISKGETLELLDGSFLRITELGFGRAENSPSVVFKGHLFRPIEEFEDYLPMRFGGSELVWVCAAGEHDSPPEGYLRSGNSKDVLRIRHLDLSNSESASESFLQTRVMGMFIDPRPLVCQWKLVAQLSKSDAKQPERSFKSIMDRSRKQPKAFIALSSQEPFLGGTTSADCSTSQHQLDSDPLRESSDGGRRRPKKFGRATSRNLGKERCRDAGGRYILAPNTNGNRIAKATRNPAIHKYSYHLGMSLAHALNISSAQRSVSEQDIGLRAYTFADAFCGAGGMSIGARDAGLRIEWAFDKDRDAINTYSLNHGNGTCKKMSAESFLESENAYGTSKVDILHLSPPCQGFTLACRGSPRNGERDNECMTYVGKIVGKVGPRIVTFEQVGAVLSKHREFFTTMVHDLTSIGYNVSWRIIQCVDFGLPQRRKRLFMIASCRGEPLPEFPEPTHSHRAYCDGSRSQPWNTFAGAIEDLEDSAPNHVQQNPRRVRPIENWAPPHPPDWPCHDTITSGENWPDHYNGKYVCTVREAACLQGFPADYKFCGKLPATKKQVVNAVPPPVAKAILEEVQRSLARTDASRRS